MIKPIHLRKNNIFALLMCLGATILFSTCKKDDAESVIDFGPNGGVHFRTNNNLPMGGDDTDWMMDGPWNAREKQLFASLNLSLDGPQQSGTWSSSVYPNPSQASAGFVFQSFVGQYNPAPASARLTYVIVDRRYKELLRDDLNGQGGSIRFMPNALAAGALYRLYYVCYVPGQQVYFRSHGDIKVE